jgi:hypothetical protein
MESKPMPWVQFLLASQFFAARIPLSLTFTRSIGTAMPEREQTAPTATAHTQERECWNIS